MIGLGKQDDAESRGEEETGGELPSHASYDPLLEPWDKVWVAGASGIEGLEADPVFRFDGEGGEAPATAWEQSPEAAAMARSLYWGAWYPPGYAEQPREELTELQRRLRAETITIPRPQRRWSVLVREAVETLLLALLIFLAVRTSFQNFRVEGLSMMPGMQDGEYLIVNKLAYAQIDLSMFDWVPFFDAGDQSIHHLWDAPGRGDVIVFRSPTSINRDFIKRIIGVPGDTVEIDPARNLVILNGQVIEEPYIQGTTTCSHGCGPWVVPEADTPDSYAACGSRACYFVMGDNRQNSSDSRQGWYVPEENVIGKALLTYWHEGGPELRLAPNHSVPLGEPAAAEE